MPETIIEVRNLVTHYGERKILDGINFSVQRGEVFVIIGASGCGKSTLIKHMSGLLKPSSGEIIYQGEDITKMDEEHLARMQRTIGIAFQSSGLLNSLTVGDNVALPLREYGVVEPRLIPMMVRMKLGLVGLMEAQHVLPDALSGGMKRRAGLARAIAMDPPLVYFDEPSAGLDPIMAAGLDELILDLKRLMGTTMVIVTHELESIHKIADRILMLDFGQELFLGTLDQALNSDQERVRQFFERRPDQHIAQRNIA